MQTNLLVSKYYIWRSIFNIFNTKEMNRNANPFNEYSYLNFLFINILR